MSQYQTALVDADFTFAMDCEIDLPRSHRGMLSAPALVAGASLAAKDVTEPGQGSRDGKFTLDEHVDDLRRRGEIGAREPLLVIGSRNSTVNPRAPVIMNGDVHAAAPERPRESRRGYFGVGTCGGPLIFAQILDVAHTAGNWDFFCAGIPVLWRGLDNEALFDAMLTETADHAHLFDIPRGNHPLASDASRATFRRLHRSFLDNLHADRPTAAAAMRAAIADGVPLRRATTYFHAVLGGRPDGSLRYVAAHGPLEVIGQRLAQADCHWAVCLENSGSVMPTFLPDGLDGERIPLARAPNFRPAGRAVIAIRLSTNTFNSGSLLENSQDETHPRAPP